MSAYSRVDSVIFQPKDDKVEKCELKSEKKIGWTARLALTVISVAVGSCTHTGFHSAVISPPSQTIQEIYNQSQIERRGITLTENSSRWLWAATVAILCLGAAVGSAVGGKMSDYFGRKRTLLVNNVFSILAAGLFMVAQYLNFFEAVIIARFLAGINMGVSFTVAGLYLAEISPKHLRGMLLAMVAVGSNGGLIIGFVLSFYIFNHDYDWAVLLGLTPFLFSVFELITLPFCPESPRWLLLRKRDELAARKALRIFRDNGYVDDEIQEMYKEDQLEDKNKVSVLHLLNPCNGQPQWRRPLGICIFFGITNAFCGMAMMWFYATSILSSAGLSTQQISLSTVLFGVDALITSAVGGRLCDKFGRRPVMLASFLICSTLQGAFCATILFQTHWWMTWVSTGIILAYIMFWNCGPGPVIFVTCPELWAQGPRQAGMSVTMQLYWWGNFACGQILPFLQNAIGAYVFVIFASFLFLSAIVLYIYVPETNNVTFGETTEYFRRKSLGLGPEDEESIKKVGQSLLQTTV